MRTRRNLTRSVFGFALMLAAGSISSILRSSSAGRRRSGLADLDLDDIVQILGLDSQFLGKSLCCHLKLALPGALDCDFDLIALTGRYSHHLGV